MAHLNKLKWLLHQLWIVVLTSMASSDLLAANHALLIGIQNYPKTPQFEKRGFQQLAGPLNDVELMKQLLSAPPFEFPKSNITELVDKQATHSGIEKAFADLKKRVKPKDFVYIHFSGHGSEAINDNPDVDKETYVDKNGKSMDETWVPYGAGAALVPLTGKNEGQKVNWDDWDIRDDEINVWLAEIGKTTERIVFVSDSCQSGSVSRGPRVGVRGIRMDPRDWPKGKSLPNVPLVGIRIGASRDQEYSYETEQNGKSYGWFTWFWSKALKALKPGETWGDLFRRTEVLMREENMKGQTRTYQTPQIDPQVLGKRDIKVGGDFTGYKGGILVAAAGKNGRDIRLSAGLLSGVTKGSIYRVFSLDQAKASAEAEIMSVTPFSSTATVLKGRMETGDRLVESQHAYSFEPVRVAIKGDYLKTGDKALSEKIAKALKPRSAYKAMNPQFEIVTGPDVSKVKYFIYLLRPDKQSGKYIYGEDLLLPNSKPSNAPEAWVLSPDGKLADDTLRVELGDAEKGIKELTRKMENVADMNDLIMLQNEPPKEFRVLAHRLIPDDTCQKDDDKCFIMQDGKYRVADTSELSALDRKTVQIGTNFGFSVENNTKMEYYLYLISISIRDGAFVLFPNPSYSGNSEFAIIPPNRMIRKLDGTVEFANTGREIIKAVVSKERLDPQAFEFAGTEKRGSSKGPTSPLERLLNRTARRSTGHWPPPPPEWGTVQAEMVVIGKD